uniref:Uncharacterized protein n=1 Tax=Anopheles coluzzii TaxID=1518534 RepID=A0A8W7PLW4_ANOCL
MEYYEENFTNNTDKAYYTDEAYYANKAYTAHPSDNDLYYEARNAYCRPNETITDANTQALIPSLQICKANFNEDHTDEAYTDEAFNTDEADTDDTYTDKAFNSD